MKPFLLYRLADLSPETYRQNSEENIAFNLRKKYIPVTEFLV